MLQQEDVTEDFHKIICEKVSVITRKMIHSDLEITLLKDNVFNEMIFALKTYVLGLADERIRIYKEWPENWWEAFKDRWFPTWLKNKYPVRYDHIMVDQAIYKAVCPHLTTDEHKKHVTFLYYAQNNLDYFFHGDDHVQD